MSRTWDLDIGADTQSPTARVRAYEHHLGMSLEIEYPDLGSLSCVVDDDSVRMLRDWLSWYLDEGPEPDA